MNLKEFYDMINNSNFVLYRYKDRFTNFYYSEYFSTTYVLFNERDNGYYLIGNFTHDRINDDVLEIFTGDKIIGIKENNLKKSGNFYILEDEFEYLPIFSIKGCYDFILKNVDTKVRCYIMDDKESFKHNRHTHIPYNVLYKSKLNLGN